MIAIIYMDKDKKLSWSLSITLMVLGHITFIMSLHVDTNLEVFTLFIIETIIFTITHLLYKHKLYLFLQSGVWFVLLFAMPLEYHWSSLLILLVWLLSFVLLLFLWIKPHYFLKFSRVSLMLTQSFYMFYYFFEHDALRTFESGTLLNSTIVQSLSIMMTTILTFFILYSFKTLRINRLALIVLSLLFIANIFIYQPLSLPLLYLALSYYSYERFMRYFSLILLAIFLIYYYFMLSMPLDEKSVIIALTGVMLLIIAYIMKHQTEVKS
jgi:hypothetical protein